jgi:glucose-6-phosphate 1-dehydrogenase
MRADALVLFGGTGDLAKKKLFPALYEMEEADELEIPVIAVASSKWTQDEFRANAEKAIRDRIKDVNEAILKRLLDELHLIVGDYPRPC